MWDTEAKDLRVNVARHEGGCVRQVGGSGCIKRTGNGHADEGGAEPR